MNPRIGVVYFTVIAFSFNLTGQSGSSEPVVYPGGISLKYGWGAYALRDNYISPERYDGVLPFYAIGWTHTHDRYVYKLNFALRQADDIKNFNVSTNIVSFKLSQGFLYPLKPLNLFDKDLSLWLGPTTDVFYFENSPDIAVSGFDYTNSFSTLISLGFRGDGMYSIAKKFSFESSLQFTILSLGMRTVDSEEDEQPGAKPLTLASGLNASFDLGMCYDLFHWLSLGLSYRFELIRITAWENILSASNGAFVGLYFRF